MKTAREVAYDLIKAQKKAYTLDGCEIQKAVEDAIRAARAEGFADARERAAKVVKDRADLWTEYAKQHGMPRPTACDPLDDIEDELRALEPTKASE